MDGETQAPALNQLFGGANPQPAGDTPTPDAGTSTETTTTETVAAETASPSTEAKPAKVEVIAEPAKEPAKEAVVSETTTQTKENASRESNWDSDDNPHKKRADDLARREKSVRDWATQLNQQNMAMQRELSVINKKLDGTYDPAVDDPKPDPQRVLSEAQIQGKVQASIASAVEVFGEEKVAKEYDRFNQLFNENSTIQQRVLSSPNPMAEAMNVLKEFDITQKYGSRNVDVIMAKVREEITAELTEKIRKEEHQKILESISLKNKTPSGLREVRPAVTGAEKPKNADRPLSSFFNN